MQVKGLVLGLILASLLFLVSLNVPRAVAIKTYDEVQLTFGMLLVNISAEATDPYDGYVTVFVNATVNATAANETGTFKVTFAFLHSIILTYDYGSKFFPCNISMVFANATAGSNVSSSYSNKTFYPQELRLHFPIERAGVWDLNVTVNLLIYTIVVFVVIPTEVPITLTLNARVPSAGGIEEITEGSEGVAIWLYPLSTVVAVESAAIVYLILEVRKLKRTGVKSVSEEPSVSQTGP